MNIRLTRCCSVLEDKKMESENTNMKETEKIKYENYSVLFQNLEKILSLGYFLYPEEQQ